MTWDDPPQSRGDDEVLASAEGAEALHVASSPPAATLVTFHRRLAARLGGRAGASPVRAVDGQPDPAE